MLVYLICYGAGMLFASCANYYMSGISLILAAVMLVCALAGCGAEKGGKVAFDDFVYRHDGPLQ